MRMTSRSARKAEVSDKVKEIKRMQQNWMKQRAHAIEEGSEVHPESIQPKVQSSPGKFQQKPAVTTFACGKGQVTKTEQPKNKGQGIKTEQPVVQIGVPSVRKVKTIQSGVWSQRNGAKLLNQNEVKTERKSEKLYHDNKDFKDKFRHWLKVKNEPIDNDSVVKVSDGSVSDDSYLPDGTISRTVPSSSEDSIENLADNIVSRVKNQLYTNDAGGVANIKAQPAAWTMGLTGAATLVDTPRSEESSTCQSGDAPSLADDDLYDSHTCPVCRNLMVQPHIPVLLVPCGHTGCQPCLASRVLCPMCGADIKSQTCNFALHQIILSHQEENTARREYSPKNYQTGTNYEEQYNSLTIRCEALSEELEDANQKLASVTEELSRGKVQCSSIENEERNLQNQINQLQESLSKLRKHREEYEKNCHSLEQRQLDERERIELLEETLTALIRDREKVERFKIRIDTSITLLQDN